MARSDAVKIALLVVAAAVLFFVAGQALRWFSRMVAWALVPLALGFLGYAVYELYSGWNDAAEADQLTNTSVDSDSKSVADLQEQYVEGELSEVELEQELDSISDFDDLETEEY